MYIGSRYIFIRGSSFYPTGGLGCDLVLAHSFLVFFG